MYQAKQQGRNKFKFFSPMMNKQGFDHFILTHDLHKALDRQEFVLHYQPQIDFKTGQVTAVEALIRWQHPHRGLLMPNEFISIAEDMGQIVAIDEWVLETACAQCREWQLRQLPLLRIAVNLSAQQLENSKAAATISKILMKSKLDPQYLEIEITERAAMKNMALAVSLLSDLKDMGIHILMDDFGTGYSSLAALKHFPVHTLKIAREFIQDLLSNAQDIAVAKAIISLAQGLNLSTVAEGVETPEQWELLRKVKCDAMQGYLLSPPLRASAITQFLLNYS